MKSLKEEGATREEIRETIAPMLEELGIELPEPRENLLTEEQRAEIQTLVEGLKEEEATREEIRAAIAAKFEEWGIELPEPQNDRRRISRRRIGRNGLINPLIMAELAIIDTEQDDGEVILAAPQATSYKTSEITTWGKLKVAR